MLLALVPAVLAILTQHVQALEVVVGSPCYDKCGAGGTSSTDVVCNDADYTSTGYGKTMASCLSCESTSLAVNDSMPNGGTTDEYWFMFNMKYTLQVCVIDSSSKTTAVQACQGACQPLQAVLDTLWLDSKPYANQYDYCSIQSGSFPSDAPKCTACLQSQEGSVVLGNFVNIMSDACSSQPLAQNNDLVSLPRALLDTTTITSKSAVTSSQSTSTPSTSGATSSITSTGTTVSSGSSSASSKAAAATSTYIPSPGSIGKGAAAGIGLAVGLGLAGAVAGLIFWLLRRQKQRRQMGPQVPELPVYSYAPPAQLAQDKDAFYSPAVSEVGDRPAAQELHAPNRYEVGAMPPGRQGPIELDAGRN